jgi:mannose-6-phosphate isomerase-like protein (cupin superfamily)
LTTALEVLTVGTSNELSDLRERNMAGSRAEVVRAAEARSFMEGDELCREYLRERRMWFGTSTLAPGERGDVDPGHASSVEVFFCCQGQVIMNDGERDYELSSGDAVIVPQGLPHALANVGSVTAVLVWAGAPG